MVILKGDKAPDFTLKNSDGEDVSLSGFAGKKNVVVLFFPLAFSSVCTDELCQVRDSLKQFESLDAEVLAISVDSFFTLKEFKKAQGYNFQLLSDFNKETAKAYGCLYDEFFGMHGVAKRSAFAVDKEGVVQYAEVLEKASDIPDFEKVKAALA
ncbi:Peroxiredoxin [Cyclonatronum proteinivorum]|uniref:Peroxiredoxin n=1 Tax=Cyclonatronum proteinivorum TaxID=1457365 RepID=A0A345ULY6_9BACT|nr:peroxiredoxin [Cyclonatronum proteinivorum]AXJ01488.1 Peroxiredoxin [Cyclonatronum proteinivorum]